MLISSLYLHENLCCGYSLEVPQRGTSNEYPQHMISGEIRKIFCGYPLLSVAMDLAFQGYSRHPNSSVRSVLAHDCQFPSYLLRTPMALPPLLDSRHHYKQKCLNLCLSPVSYYGFVCVEVLRPSQPNGVMSSSQFT